MAVELVRTKGRSVSLGWTGRLARGDEVESHASADERGYERLRQSLLPIQERERLANITLRTDRYPDLILLGLIDFGGAATYCQRQQPIHPGAEQHGRRDPAE
jgi:hypothetical protein